MEKSYKFTLSIAIIIASFVLGIFHYLSRQEDSTVKVVGYAVQSFEADLARWSFNISETANFTQLKSGYLKLNNKLNKLKEIISSKELDSIDLIIKPVRINDIYDRNGITSKKKFSQDIVITSKSIDEIEEISTNPSIFIDNNILFEYSNIEFYSTQLDVIKKKLLGQAIINAKERAIEILTAANNVVGKLMSARSGVFQITEPLSTEIAGYGLHSTSTKKKNIKVTVSAEFDIN